MPQYRRNYPESVRDVLNGVRFKRETIRAMKEFKSGHPWRGSVSEKKRKYNKLLKRLSRIYHIEKPKLMIAFTREDTRPLSSGSSSYTPSLHRITLNGKFSVVTFLHEFCHARGYDERYACKWSLNLFRKIFPRNFARMGGSGHCLVSTRVEDRRKRGTHRVRRRVIHTERIPLSGRRYTTVRSHKRKLKGRKHKVKRHRRRIR